MANGSIVNPVGCWEGIIELGGATVAGSFEVFDSCGGWDFLFRKRLLTAFSAVHDYATDEVFLPTQRRTLQNQYSIATQILPQTPQHTKMRETKEGDDAQSPVRGVLIDNHQIKPHVVDTPIPVSITQQESVETQQQQPADNSPRIEELTTVMGDKIKSPSREVPNETITTKELFANSGQSCRASIKEIEDEDSPQHKKKEDEVARAERRHSEGDTATPPVREVSSRDTHIGNDNTNTVDKVLAEPGPTPICVVSEDAPETNPDYTAEIPTEELTSDNDNIFTRGTDPFKPARVEEIRRLVKIGDDLTDHERSQVQSLVTEFADVFALSVSEVTQVEGAVHRLNIDPNAKFSTKVHQKLLTPPQRKYLHEKLQAMLDADIIEPCEPGQVKCVSPTTLAQKTHEGAGLTLEELQHPVNDECVNNGLEPHFPLPPRPVVQTTADEAKVEADEPKWRICQNFSQINKVTQVAPMPQGDIRSKQQRLSGHRWVSTFDFAAGFYVVLVDPESRPYTAFYVEGWGYFWYKRMPFGLMGAPSTFAHMTGQHLYDLLIQEIMELFIDGGAAADEFSEMMSKLRHIFLRVREHGLSLSASKSKLFMTTAVFAGATIGPNGVQPDLSKLKPLSIGRDQTAHLICLPSWDSLVGSVTSSRTIRRLNSH
jgi:hypothetical protein